MGRAGAITLFLGMGWLVVSTLFRIMHWPWANLFRIISYGCLAIGCVLFSIAAIKNKGFTGLLDPPVRDNDPR